MKTLASCITTALVAGLWLAAPPADAGTMVVYSCHTPSGRPVATDGWTLSTDNAVLSAGVGNSCSEGPAGVLKLAVQREGAKVDGSQEVNWTFRAAELTTVSEFNAWVCGRGLSAQGFARVWWQPRTEFDPAIIVYKNSDGKPDTMGCQGPSRWWTDARNMVQGSHFSTPYVMATAGCAGICEADPKVQATLEVGAFKARIDDPTSPTAGTPGGSLVSAQVHTATESIVFPVTDRGTGVFRVIGEARLRHAGPWLPVAETPLGGASCRPIAETDYLYEFASPQPCPTALAGASLTMDNTLLGAGSHDFRVSVEDASGNRAVVWQTQAYDVAATVAPVQLTITAPARLGTRRRFEVRGRLSNAESEPSGGASVVIQSRGHFPKGGRPFGQWTTIGTAVTDTRGVYRFRVSEGPSRTLRALYSATAAGGPTAVALANVAVPARVAAHARRSRVRNGQLAVFAGRVSGPIPSGGLVVSLEAREPGRWVPVATTRRRVRTRADGRFTLRYRFTRTFHPTTYRFRVVSDEDSDYPYARGVSRTVTVRVRP